MLSRIISNRVRYSNHPNLARNTHHYHSGSSRNTRLTQLNKDCLSALKKVEINTSLQKTMITLDTEYCLNIALEADAEYQSIPDSAIFEPDDSPEAEERAHGLQLARGLRATANFLENYSVTVPEITLEAAITPRHQNHLLSSLRDSFPLLSEANQRAFASAVHPEALNRLGLTLSPALCKLSLANQQMGKPQLARHHVLALLDYCNSKTGNFNAVNDGLRTWQLCGIDKLASITSCLANPLNEALSILSLHDEFLYRGPAFKGIALGNAAGQFRLSKMQPGMEYTSPHWSSATYIESKNYSNRSDDERCSKLVFVQSEGVHVHMFNDQSSIDEGEIMIRPKPVVFLPADDVDRKLAKPVRDRPTLYCTMKPVSSESGSAPLESYAVPV